MKNKVLQLDELAKVVAGLKKDSKKIVHCHGVFDLLHIGHIRHLHAAKLYGDVLIITVTPDKYVGKGPHRPAFNENLRAEALAALDKVDYVAINKWPTASKTINLLKPDLFAKGVEYKDSLDNYASGFAAEKAAVNSAGGELVFTEEITSSSSELINSYYNLFPEETDVFLTGFSSKYSFGEIEKHLESVNNLKVLVIGEAVIDEYQFGRAMGRARREPIIIFNVETTEKYPGGVLAVANHVSNYCSNVDLIALIGDRKTQIPFIKAHLNENINAILYGKENSPTIVKRRFIDVGDNHKLFEVYDFKDTPLDERRSNELSNDLKKTINKYDLVIVCDAGHGLFTPEIIKVLETAKYFSINTQDNPGNFGFNTINKYQNPNYVCINEAELRLATGTQYDDINHVITNRFEGLPVDKVLVTRGWKGCIIYTDGKLLEVPAFADKVVDKVGAGDAVLSITSPLASVNVPMDVIAFIGNVAGALAVSYAGNKESINKEKLYRYIKALMR